jgi:DTW domain-containing protein YfiP
MQEPHDTLYGDLPSLKTSLRVLILQHPREQQTAVASAPLALRCLPRSQRVIGLSWRSLQAALEDAGPANEWAVLVAPRRDPQTGASCAAGLNRSGRLRGIIALDGTWSQAKSLWWRNPWLLKCARLSLCPIQPSIYGSLRKQPRRDCLSTLEAIAGGLSLAGEPPEVEEQLRRTFRGFVQRARDARPKKASSRRPLP